jgi:hypothetical protein
MATLLDAELMTYEENRESLLGSADGKSLLIKANQILGVYDSEMDAIAQGYRQFGNVPFLVKQDLKIESPQNFVSNLLGCSSPLFTSQIPNLQGVGPVVELQPAVGAAAEAAMRQAAVTPATSIRVTAMIDTGATGSVIQQGLPAQLNLQPIGVTYITTPSSTNVPCHEYLVRLIFPNNVLAETLILEAPLQGQHIQCLIGRDVLAHGVVVYIGYGNLLSLCF